MQSTPRTGTTTPPPTRRTRTRRLAGTAAAVAAVVSLTTLSTPGAHAADNPYERGPAPTRASIEAP
ncbi:alpha/beta hydrolase, partial [Streptomyces sp. CAI-78]|nr:alpha/beta hydrolase [Streptomyces sp. CAI-78]